MASFTSRRARNAYPYVFLLPAVAVFTVFFVLPAVLGLYLSLTDASILRSDSRWVGLDNYVRLFGPEGRKFFASISNQALFAIVTTLGKTGLGVAIAFLLNRAFVGRNFIRAVVYLPIMFSTIVVGILFNFILRRDGPFNGFLDAIGLGFLRQDWFGNFDIALFSIAGVDIWMGTGWTVVLVIAALQSIPEDVIDAAKLDGAKPWQMVAFIKIPFILHAINLALLLTFISGMQAFDIIYATTGGGPGTATEVMGTFISRRLAAHELGFPAAASFVQFVLITAIAIVINRFVARKEASLS